MAYVGQTHTVAVSLQVAVENGQGHAAQPGPRSRAAFDTAYEGHIRAAA